MSYQTLSVQNYLLKIMLAIIANFFAVPALAY